MNSAFVTGATGGIGRSIVEALTARGMSVHAIGRQKKTLQALEQKTGCHVHCLDLSNIEAVQRLVEKSAVDILINCAGCGAAPGPLQATPTAAIDAVVDVNFRAPLHLIASVIPGMLDRGRGHIINIGSIAGLYPIPNSAVYAASKSGIHALSSLLRLDLKGSPIKVTEICPGRVETNFFATITGDAKTAQETYFDDYKSLQPDDITSTVLFALDAPTHVNISMIELSPQGQVFGGIDFAPKKHLKDFKKPKRF